MQPALKSASEQRLQSGSPRASLSLDGIDRVAHRGYSLRYRDRVLGWANATVTDGALEVELGYVERSKRARPTASAIDEERASMARFVGARGG
jgi:hypothetical protein